MLRQTTSSIAPEEIDHFSAMADEWWNPEGTFRSLHRLNPLRVSYVLERVASYREPIKGGKAPALKGLSVLDVGCGGGLLAEAMALEGASVTGLDASDRTIEVAKAHAKTSGLKIDYQVNSVEALALTGKQYDLITAFEVIEHVANRKAFLAALKKLLKPGGLLVMATVNRTTKSYLLGIVVAEYVLGWIPPGTHDWEAFIKPSELVPDLEAAGFETGNLCGVVFDPLRGAFVMRPHMLDVNYMLSAVACA